MPAPATNPAPAETSDIKSHVSNEVKAGVAEVQKTIADKHQQLVTLVAPAAAKTAPAAAKPAAAPELPPPNVAELQTILGSLSLSGRPMLAGLSSAVILLFTEARDTIAWVSAGLSNAATSHQLLPPLPPLPQSTGQVGAFLNGAYAYINAAAASLPNEWIFRLHIAAMLLIVYAVYRVRAAHLDLRKLQARVDAARQYADTAKQNVETARQDVAEVRQIVDDVNQIVRIVK
jgi:cell division protein FtsB